MLPNFVRHVVAGAATCCALLSWSCSSDPEAPEATSAPPPLSVEVVRPIELTDDARLPEQDPNFASAEVHADHLLFQYKAAPTPNFEVGNVVGGVQAGGYIRRVTSIAVDGTMLTVSTEPAELVEFIRDGAFRVKQHPPDGAWATGDPMIGGHQAPLSVRVPLLKLGKPVSCAVGSDTTVGGGIALLDVVPIFDLIDSDLDLALDIKPDPVAGLGKLEQARFVFSASVEAGIQGSYVGSAVGTCTLDITKLIESQIGISPKLQLPPIAFAVGPVPVVITHAIKPTLKLDGKVSATSDGIHVSYLSRHDLRVGSEYQNGQWQGIWEPKRTGKVDVSVPSGLGYASAQASLWSGLEYGAYLYDLAGPKVGLESGFTGKVSTNPETCVWNATLRGDIRASLSGSLKVPVIDREIFKVTGYWSLLTGELGAASGDLPKAICEKPVTPPDVPPPPPTEPPPPGAPPDVLEWWTQKTTKSSKGNGGTSDESATTEVWVAPSGWEHASVSKYTSDNDYASVSKDSTVVIRYQTGTGMKTTTTTSSSTATIHATGETVTSNDSPPPTTEPCANGCAWSGIEKPGYDYDLKLPKPPYCNVSGDLIGYDGQTYTSTTTTSGGVTITDTFTCKNCGGKSSEGCSCSPSS